MHLVPRKIPPSNLTFPCVKNNNKEIKPEVEPGKATRQGQDPLGMNIITSGSVEKTIEWNQ